MSGEAPAKLRVALLIHGFMQPAWIARVIGDLAGSEDAEIVLVVRRAPYNSKPQSWLWRAYRAIDERIFRVRPDPRAPVDIASFVDGVPAITVTPLATEDGIRLADDDVDSIEAHGIDVALSFDFGPLRGRALTVARHGVWAYDDGGFWEVAERDPVTVSVLRTLTDDRTGQVLYRSWASTDRRSVARNNGHRLWQSAAFVGRALRELRRSGAPGAEPGSKPGPRTGAPGDLRIVRTMTGIPLRFARDKLPELATKDQWTLAYAIGPDGAMDPTALERLAPRMTPILPPRDRFWADPFVTPAADGWLIFFEELPYRSGKGHITALPVSRVGTVGEPFRVLERDYHLSYPCVFEWDGSWWMVPETMANGTVELYRATSFPRDWVLDRVLLDGVRAVDATLVQIGDSWWMFVNLAEPGAWTDDELHLFRAPTPLGPWTPHVRNPVVSDVRRARPAGRPFLFRDRWYRPAQDSSIRYGGALVINRIDALNDSAYREVPVARLDPRWRRGNNGAHTINSAAGLTVIDVRIRRSRFR